MPGSDKSVEQEFYYFIDKHFLVGGFNPFEKYKSNWIISPGRGENNMYLNHHLALGFGLPFRFAKDLRTEVSVNVILKMVL